MNPKHWESLPRIEVSEPKSIKGQQLKPYVDKKIDICVRHSTSHKSPTRRRISPLRIVRVDDPRYPFEYLEAFCHLRNEPRIFKVSDLTILPAHDCNPDNQPAITVFPGDLSKPESEPDVSSKQKGSGVMCTVIKTELFDDYDRLVPAVEATCTRCGHTTESFGEGENSVKRCLALMREECPKKQANFYISD